MWDIKDNHKFFAISPTERGVQFFFPKFGLALVTCLTNRTDQKWYFRISRLSHEKPFNFCWTTCNTGETPSCHVRSLNALKLLSWRYRLWALWWTVPAELRLQVSLQKHNVCKWHLLDPLEQSICLLNIIKQSHWHRLEQKTHPTELHPNPWPRL